MSHSRGLIRPFAFAYARAYAQARSDLAQMAYERQREVSALRHELDEIRALCARRGRAFSSSHLALNNDLPLPRFCTKLCVRRYIILCRY